MKYTELMINLPHQKKKKKKKIKTKKLQLFLHQPNIWY